MKMLFKQRFFSWFDSYDIYNEAGAPIYNVEGKLAWGHKLQINDAYGNPVGMVREKVITFLPKFELYVGDHYVGQIEKEFTFFKPKFNLDFNGWHVEGDWMSWNYQVIEPSGKIVMRAEKLIWNFTDTYQIDVLEDQYALVSLMIVLAIDAVKCSNNG